MSMEKVWIFLTVAAFLATGVTSKQVLGAGNRQPRQELAGNGSLGHHLAHKGTLKQEVLTGPSIRSEFSGHPQGNFQDVEKKMLDQSLTKRLFNNEQNVLILQRVIKSAFVTGMTEGTIPVEQYRRYMIQDAVYLSNGARLYAEAAQRIQNQPELMKDPTNFHIVVFYRQQAKKFEGYYKAFLNTWQLKDAEKIETGVAVEIYMGYQQAVVNNNPRNLAIAMLPCSMLYPYLANVGVKNPMQNPYNKDWFEVNKREGESSTEKFVNKYLAVTYGKFEDKLEIFLNGMLSELNFFLEAGNQPLLSLQDALIRNVD